jgi:hypothetical protein
MLNQIDIETYLNSNTMAIPTFQIIGIILYINTNVFNYHHTLNDLINDLVAY